MIQKFLDKITGPYVRLAGWFLALALTFWHPQVLLPYGFAVAFSILFWYEGKHMLAFLSNFADPQFWPTFVSLGIAGLLAAHQGGWLGPVAVGILFMILDGIYFEQNY